MASKILAASTQVWFQKMPEIGTYLYWKITISFGNANPIAFYFLKYPFSTPENKVNHRVNPRLFYSLPHSFTSYLMVIYLKN